ncbi:uncharacterized protein LOC124293399 [Neodiprion lecontei]|uniref:Uncharacterized protein LOC124293399 n=1 Tax=Neodiprion lecontei TaxID=441921 RepID=A0ABM3FQ96_NEOLC|nr:uncharacterized protein LOC124293399 [Neodiprion lecontei]
MSNKTGWIQNLNKGEIIQELQNRGVAFEEGENYNTLRELLRSEIKKSEKKETSEQAASSQTQVDGSESKKPIKKTTLPTQEKVANDKSSSDDTSNVDSDKDSDMGDPHFQFNLDDDWELFEDKLDFFFTAKKITEESIKIANLVTHLSDDAHALLKQLAAPKKIKDTSFAENIKLMSDHLKPKPSETMERCTFHKASQKENETIADFVARLKKLSLYCNFSNLDDALKDQFVCGIKDRNTRVKLFEEKSLTFKIACEIATTRESAEKDAASSENALDTRNAKADVFALRGARQPWQQHRGSSYQGRNQGYKNNYNGRQQQQHRNQRSSSEAWQGQRSTQKTSVVKCSCCGKGNHTREECRYRDLVCHQCNVKGHLAQVCSFTGNKFPTNTNVNLLQSENDERVEESSEYDFFKLNLTEYNEYETIVDCKTNIVNDDVPHVNVNANPKLENDAYNCAKVKSNESNALYKHTSKQNVEATPMFILLNVNGINVYFEVDSGTYATVISKRIYDQYFSNLKLHNTTSELKAYCGQPQKPLGELIDVKIVFNNVEKTLNCFVLPGPGPALIGRLWLKEFGVWPLNLPTPDKCQLYKIDNFCFENNKNIGGEKRRLESVQKLIFRTFFGRLERLESVQKIIFRTFFGRLWQLFSLFIK